jgi:integrase
MRGSVKRHGGSWRYRIDLGPDPLTGKRRQLAKSGFATRRAAEEACARAIDDAKRNQLVRTTRTTVADFLEDWIASRKLDMKPTSWQGYRDYLDSYVLPIIGPSQLKDLDTRRLNLLYVHLLERGRTKPDHNRMMYEFWLAERQAGREPTAAEVAAAGGVTYSAGHKALIRYRRGQAPADQTGGLAPKTVRNTHVMLHGALADAVRWNLIPRNPATDARPPRVRRKRHLIWNTDQLRTFVDHARSDRYAGLWLLVCTTGLRRSELAGLRRGDLDLEHERISSGDTRVVVRGRAEDSDGKSDDSLRTIALDPVTVTALRVYLTRWEEEKAAFGHAGEHLFCHPDGRPIHPDTITDWFTRLSWEAGLPPIRLHDVRHSYATAALRAGVPVKVVSERLGHDSVSFTQDTYMHVIPGMDEHGARLAAAAILGPPAAPEAASVTNRVTISGQTPPETPLT